MERKVKESLLELRKVISGLPCTSSPLRRQMIGMVILVHGHQCRKRSRTIRSGMQHIFIAIREAVVLPLSIDNDTSWNTCFVEVQESWVGGRNRYSVGKTNVIPSNKLTNASSEENHGLMNNGTFETADVFKAGVDICVFDSSVVYRMKPTNNGIP